MEKGSSLSSRKEAPSSVLLRQESCIVAQVRHCTTPEGAVYIACNVQALPRVVQVIVFTAMYASLQGQRMN